MTLIETATGKERLTIPFPRSVPGPVGSPSPRTEKLLAASGGASTRVFDAVTGKETVEDRPEGDRAAFLRAGQRSSGRCAAPSPSGTPPRAGRSLPRAEKARSPRSR